ncbi:MAG: serine/threonine protein kinase, partial [Deltaproteobacteria bacterium]|nr:serine/threonine protein kinase [Deltaproteobacteria bacterium]
MTTSLEDKINRAEPPADPIAAKLVQANLLRRLADVETGAPRLGRFVVLARVGEGSHGVVYAAYDPKLDRRVALKRLHRGEGAGHRRLLREARALAQLSHPNVVTVFEVGEADGNAYVAMEYVEGTTLAQWLSEASRPIAEITAVLRSAGRGLANAHAHGLVHRDFKPSNVMVGADGRVRVTDFGLADYHQPAVTETDGAVDDPAPPPRRVASTIVGTPVYMAPELLDGAAADTRSDQFAYCVTLVEALTGRRPFEGETPEALAESIRRGPSPELLHMLPRWLRRLVVVGLDPEPDRRHADLGALVDALDRHTRGRSWMGWTVAAMALVAIPLSWGRGAQQESSCDQLAHALDDIWSPARRDTLRSSFAATGRPYAQHALTFVTAAVDRYARQWTEASVAACGASPQVYVSSGRQVCLERRRQELDGLLAELGAADEQLVGSSTSAVSSLVPVGACDHPDPSMDTSALEPGPRARLAEIDRELAHLWVLVLTGAYERARDGLAPL